MAFYLDGHVALVTGSSTGLGKGAAAVLAPAGAKVADNYCHNQQLSRMLVANWFWTITLPPQANTVRTTFRLRCNCVRVCLRLIGLGNLRHGGLRRCADATLASCLGA